MVSRIIQSGFQRAFHASAKEIVFRQRRRNAHLRDTGDAVAGMIGPRPARIVLQILFPVVDGFGIALVLIQQLSVVEECVGVSRMN